MKKLENELKKAADEILGDSEAESRRCVARALVARERVQGAFGIGNFINNLKSSSKEFVKSKDKAKLKELVKDVPSFVERLVKLEIIETNSANPDRGRWRFTPKSVGEILLGDRDELESSTDSGSLFQDAEATTVTISKGGIPIVFPTSSGFVVRFQLPEDFSRTDADRLKKLLDVYVKDSG